MRTEHLSASFLVVLVVLAAGGCGNTSDAPGTGGDGSLPGAGGTGGNGSGGSSPTGGGFAVGGTGGSSGTSAVGSGGTPAAGAGVGGVTSAGAGGMAQAGRGNGGSEAGSGAGRGSGGRGGATASGGASAAGGAHASGGAGSGGTGTTAGSSSGGQSAGGAGNGSGGRGGGSTGTCTASKSANANASGTGPHKVTVETNSGSGISQGTIFRPTDLGGTEKYPIFVWGEGGCSENGLSNSAAMAEIASYGYFVIADGTPNNSASRSQTSDVVSMAKPLIAYIDWAVAENDKSCSAYYQSLDTTKIASNGFSCGGLMAEGTGGDSRITTWGLNSSGLLSADQSFYKTVHTPVLIVLGGSGDVAYTNGERDYDNISKMNVPIMLFSKALGHGGDLFSNHGGDFTKIDIAWLNWWLKGDETATGKGLLVGSSCPYCSDSAWEKKSANLP